MKFPNDLEKEWKLQRRSTKKPHSLAVLFFGIGIFKGCNTFSWNHACYEFQFFRNFQDKPRNFSGVCRKASTTLLAFFLEETTDIQVNLLFWMLRYPAQCTGLERLPETSHNKICYRLHPIYTAFSYFQITCSSTIWKSLYLRNRSYLRYFWYLQWSWLNVIEWLFC